MSAENDLHDWKSFQAKKFEKWILISLGLYWIKKWLPGEIFIAQFASKIKSFMLAAMGCKKLKSGNWKMNPNFQFLWRNSKRMDGKIIRFYLSLKLNKVELYVLSTFSNICPHFQAIKLDMLHHHMHYHMQHTVCSKMRLTMNSWHSINYWTMNRLLKINVATWNQLNWIYHILKYAFIELLMVMYWYIPIYKIELATFCIKL